VFAWSVEARGRSRPLRGLRSRHVGPAPHRNARQPLAAGSKERRTRDADPQSL